ncbi:four helix bundle suffix domain-containing protein [Pontiellaceae bacterium B12219]|nr:four helix bundle suffix domain-containing protein [Pontiellaceae bacterium B12219]
MDYEDFLRHRHLEMWEMNSPDAQAVRNVPRGFKLDRSDQSDLTDLKDQERAALYAKWLEHADGAVRANALICLIHQTNYLLDQQIQALEEQFVSEGGYSELLSTERLKERQKQKTTDLVPDCPTCGKSMVLRTVKTGKNAGHQFWGCSAYPDCKGVIDV